MCKRDARHIDANRPAFKDSTPETLKKIIPLIIQILIDHAEIWISLKLFKQLMSMVFSQQLHSILPNSNIAKNNTH